MTRAHRITLAGLLTLASLAISTGCSDSDKAKGNALAGAAESAKKVGGPQDVKKECGIGTPSEGEECTEGMKACGPCCCPNDGNTRCAGNKCVDKKGNQK